MYMYLNLELRQKSRLKICCYMYRVYCTTLDANFIYIDARTTEVKLFSRALSNVLALLSCSCTRQLTITY